jgi:hypothetical protein
MTLPVATSKAPEQIDGAMPDVVVRPLFRFIERHGDQRLSTVKCLLRTSRLRTGVVIK